MENSFVQRSLYNWLLRETAPSGVRKVAPLQGAIASEIGNVRSDNQDKAIAFKGADTHGRDYAIAVVADGIGGMSDGAACAALAISSFTSEICHLFQLDTLPPKERMKRAAHFANETVYRHYLGRGGSTLVAVLLSAGTPPVWVSAGDSRIYLQSRSSLKLLTTDDTIAGQLNKSGDVPAEHSKILQYVGMGKYLEPHIGDVKEENEGQLILTTDGVHFLDKNSEWFRSIIGNAPDAGATAKRLIDLANWCGGPDNATIACVGFPFHQSWRRASEGGLKVWDAFGELDIQSQPHSLINSTARNSNLDKNLGSASDADDRNVNPNFTGEDELTLFPSESKVSDQPKVKSPRKPRAKKNADVATPKLDIEFHKKD